ncbi:unnamed protein product, partial [Choristocarpus tenellus]
MAPTLSPPNLREKKQVVISTMGICAVRVLLLIDISPALTARGDDCATLTTLFLDGLRLSILRVMIQNYFSCPDDSRVEWCYWFFDSRSEGIGKTPLELRARLRSRLPRKRRGFAHFDKSSFRVFGEDCLAMICAVQDDPFLRDQTAILRRWSQGKRQHPPGMTESELSGQALAKEEEGKASTRPESEGSRVQSKNATWGDSCNNRQSGRPHLTYDGHDMSSQSVVTRSLSEVMDEFGDSDEGGALPLTDEGLHQQPRRLLILHSPCPLTELAVERFVLSGNYSQEASCITKLPPGEARKTACSALLKAGLGIPTSRASDLHVSLVWMNGQGEKSCGKGGSKCNDLDKDYSQPMYSVENCLSSPPCVQGSGILAWSKVVGCTGVLPLSTVLKPLFCVEGPWGKVESEGRGSCLTINLGVEVDGSSSLGEVCLTTAPLSRRNRHKLFTSSEQPGSRPNHSKLGCSAGPTTEVVKGRGSKGTPWRILGTLPVGDTLNCEMSGVGAGGVVILREEQSTQGPLNGDGPWAALLQCLLSEGLVAVMCLPLSLFMREDWGKGEGTGIDEPWSLAVAFVVPVHQECAVAWRVASSRQKGENKHGSHSGEWNAGANLHQQLVKLRPLLQSSLPTATTSAQHPGLCKPLLEWCDEHKRNVSLSYRFGGRVSRLEGERVLYGRRSLVVKALEGAAMERQRRRQARKVPIIHGIRKATLSVDDNSIGGELPSSLDDGDAWACASLSSACFTTDDRVEELEAGCEDQGPLGWDQCDNRDRDSHRAYQASQHSYSSLCSYRLADAFNGEDPQQAPHHVLEESSSRPSFLGPDATYFSTPESKIGRSASSGVCGSSCGRGDEQKIGLDENARKPIARANGEACLFSEAARTKSEGDPQSSENLARVGKVPLSFLIDEAFADLASQYLDEDIVSMAERCKRVNDQVVVPINSGGIVSEKNAGVAEVSRVNNKGLSLSSAWEKYKAENGMPVLKGVEGTVLSRRRQKRRCVYSEKCDVGNGFTAEGDMASTDAPLAVMTDVGRGAETGVATASEADAGVEIEPGRTSARCAGSGYDEGEKGAASVLTFDDLLRAGVARLQDQYHQVVEGGRASPVDFVVKSVPEAVQELANWTGNGEGDTSSSNGKDGTTAAELNRAVAWATAQVLQAVTRGLSACPAKIGARHRSKRGAARPLGQAKIEGEGGTSAVNDTNHPRSVQVGGVAVASPTLQKVREYQLQALLLCQITVMAMGLPGGVAAMADTKEKTTPTNGVGEGEWKEHGAGRGRSGGGGSDRVGERPDKGKGKGKGKGKNKVKSTRKGKGKGKGRSDRTDAEEEEEDDIWSWVGEWGWPSDPLPALHQRRLEEYLQPISTILDAGTLTEEVQSLGAVGSTVSTTRNNNSLRACNGTLGEFLEFGLADNFSSSLPRTLEGLFEELERPQPNALVEALADLSGGPILGPGVGEGGSQGGGVGTAGDASKAVTAMGGAVIVDMSGRNAVDTIESVGDLALCVAAAPRGILASDRRIISHNHFTKMPGVLNTFRKVTVPALRGASSIAHLPAGQVPSRKGSQSESRFSWRGGLLNSGKDRSGAANVKGAIDSSGRKETVLESSSRLGLTKGALKRKRPRPSYTEASALIPNSRQREPTSVVDGLVPHPRNS